MNKLRFTKSMKNLESGLILRLLNIVLSFFSRTLFINYLGSECLGLNGLFTTILSLFSLAELGIGEAITFYMYKPIAENNDNKLRQLVWFYKICYRIIGIAIFIIGICMLPILPNIVNLDTGTGYNSYYIYILYLLNTVITYIFFSYPQTVLTANQEQYIVTNCTSIFSIIIFVFDFISLFITRNYYFYLICRILIMILQNFTVLLIAKKKYKYMIKKPNHFLKKNEIRKMFTDVYSVFIVNLSGKLFESTDNIFISIFLGTVRVGYNSNYLLFTNAVRNIINTVIYAFGGSIGNLVATENNETKEKTFIVLDYINFVISFSSSLFLFALLNPFIILIWGEGYIFSMETVALICFNFYLVTNLTTVFLFRQSMGLFKFYAYNQLLAAIANIVMDFIFVKKYGIGGLYLSSILASLTFAVFPFIKNIFEKGFNSSPNQQIKITILRYFYAIVTGLGLYVITLNFPNTVLYFFIRLIICSVFIILMLLLGIKIDRRFMSMLNFIKEVRMEK